MKLFRILVAPIALALLACGSVFAQSDELLRAEDAFAFSVDSSNPQRLAITWDIADGYYMYRDKFRVEVTDGDVTVTELLMPPGKLKTDEYFGEQEIYTGAVTFDALLDRSAAPDASHLTIEVMGQGCNEPIGVCYPPLKQVASLQVSAVEATASPAVMTVAQVQPAEGGAVSSLDSLKELLGGIESQPQFLEPDQAFRFDLSAADAASLRAQFDVAAGYYLYRDKLKFTSQTPGVELAEYQLPPGIEKTDEYFGTTQTYQDGFSVQLPLHEHQHGGTTAQFLVSYQGCADKGICYPPVEKSVVVNLLPFQAAYGATDVDRGSSDGPADAGDDFWGYVIAAFGVGLLLTFTPCVLPLVPIMSSFIVGQSDGPDSNRLRGGLLSIVYVLGTAVTYTAAGVLAGATGDQLQAYFQNIWFIGFVSVVLVLLALSMFGLYEIQMPGAIQSRLQHKTQNMSGGNLALVFVLGMLSALIVGACVSPLLIGALGVAIVSGDPVLGGAIMFAMALGMGVFLVLIGVGLGTLLPRAGAWMDTVKYAFGVILIGTAIYLLGSIPWIPVLYLWSALFIITAVYVGALQAVPEGASGWRYLWKGVGVFLLTWGVLSMLGAMSGGRDILKPVDLARWGSPQSPVQQHLDFARVNNLQSLDKRLHTARAEQRPVMLDYYADWCVDCIRMENSTFTHPQVVDAMAHFELVQVDLTDAQDAAAKAVKTRYGVYGPPAMLFFDRSGQERADLRRYGYMDADDFLAHIEQL